MRPRFLVGPFVLIIIWAIVTESGLVKPLFLPTPRALVIEVFGALKSGDLVVDAIVTVRRTLLAFTLSTVLGLLVGVPVGIFRRFGDSAELILDFFRSLPSPALVPLAMLMFGLGDAARISVAAFTCTLINALQIAYAVRSISQQRIAIARLEGASGRFLFINVLVPSIAPALTSTLRVTVSLSLIIIVVSEMFIGSEYGLGARILDLHLVYNIPLMYGYILILGLLGYALNTILAKLDAYFVHWRTR